MRDETDTNIFFHVYKRTNLCGHAKIYEFASFYDRSQIGDCSEIE